MPSPKNNCPECGNLKSHVSKVCRNCAKPNSGTFKKGCNQSIYIECDTEGCSIPTTTKKAMGLCDKCYTKYRKKNNLGAFGRFTFTCPECGKQYKSRDVKKFCSLNCYNRSPEFIAMARRNIKKAQVNTRKKAGYSDPSKRLEVVCKNCGKKYQTGKAVYLASRKCCSRKCSREYFAKRYDRFIANPEEVLLPQAYDEFLTKEKLPCLIEGCDWEGKALTHHINVIHGIPKDVFKEIAGFNRKTGVITAELSELLGKRRQQWFEGHPVVIENMIKRIGKYWSKEKKKKRGKVRPEAIEHLKKSLRDDPERLEKIRLRFTDFVHSNKGKKIISDSTKKTAKREAKKLIEKNCSVCDKTYLAQQRFAKHSKYCSMHCTNTDPVKKHKYGTNKDYHAECFICKKEIFVTWYQLKRYKKTGKVYCSEACKEKGKAFRKKPYNAGDKCHFAKLTWDIVDIIRAKKGKVLRRELAREYGVSEGCIKGVWNNHTWIKDKGVGHN